MAPVENVPQVQAVLAVIMVVMVVEMLSEIPAMAFLLAGRQVPVHLRVVPDSMVAVAVVVKAVAPLTRAAAVAALLQIGRASCRERV